MKNIIESVQSKSARVIVPLVLTTVWTLLEVFSLFAGGIVAFNAYWVIATLSRLAMIGLNLWFIKAFFLDGRFELYGAFRKYTGYGVVLGYGAANLPILAWQAEAGLGDSQAFFLWIVAALQALAMMAVWVALRLKGSQVFYGYISAAEAKDKKLLQQRLKSSRRGPLAVVLENADMFIQTIFIVILLQIFIFQLYVIPSESMVPTMLLGDRPFVVKTLDGPTIPLSGVKLPEMTEVKRGQIVVFESPAYVDPPLYIKVVQQVVFYLTLSLVDLDKDENGQPKVHYVVKRVAGEPGEKLMMVDDVLYVKTAADPVFKPLVADEEYSHVDLWKEADSIKNRIEAIKVTEDDRALLDRWDARRQAVEATAMNNRLANLDTSLQKEIATLPAAALARIDAQVLVEAGADAATVYAAAERSMKTRNYTVFQNFSNLLRSSSLAILHHLATTPSDRPQLSAFLRSAVSLDDVRQAAVSLYDKSSSQLNLLYKELFARQLLALVRVAAAGGDDWSTDREAAQCKLDALELNRYITHWDERNFPEFPAAKDEYIPQGKFFLMGDNRYNSLDFRFDAKSEAHTRSLDGADTQSLIYYSIIAPRLLDRSRIIGHVVFRLFPFDRLGLIKP